MKYSEARSQIKTGDLLAWSSGSWRSWHDIQVNLVRVFTRSEFSHVGIALVGAGRIFVLEAVSAGVRLFPLSRALPFWWVRRPDERGEFSAEAIDFAFDRLGDRYSRLQAIRAFFGTLAAGEDDRWQCAEYVLGVLDAAGEKLTETATPTGVVSAAARVWGPIHLVERDL